MFAWDVCVARMQSAEREQSHLGCRSVQERGEVSPIGIALIGRKTHRRGVSQVSRTTRIHS